MKHHLRVFSFDTASLLKVGLLLLVGLQLLATVNCGGGGTSTRSETVQRLTPGTVSPTANPLVAQYTISAPAATTVTIEFGPDLNYGFQTSPQAAPPGGGAVTVLVAGMRQSSVYHMAAVVTYSDGSEQFDTDHTFGTGTIPPARLPQVVMTTPSGSTPAPGVELLSLTPGTTNQLMTLALDPSGQVIWYYDFGIPLSIAQPIKLLPNGHILMVLAPGHGYGTLREIDLAGNVVRQLTYSDVSQSLINAGYNIPIVSLDHDVLFLPNGHLILLATTNRVFTDLPGYPGQTVVYANAIVDLDPNNNVAWAWNAFDHLDVNRHPMGFPDWTHANTLFYSTDDGNLLISLRHQYWVLKIDYRDGQGSGDVLWKLGYQGDFELSSGAPANWFYAQHDSNIASPNTTGDFQLAVFDNGNNRVLDDGTICGLPGAPLCYSRGAILEVNEDTRTANVIWAYTLPFSSWGGVTQLLPNGNVFVDVTSPADNPNGARVLELTQDPKPKIIWQLDINGQNSYRTIHLPSLYPGVEW
jgi:arylsulfate sulfotransferase